MGPRGGSKSEGFGGASLYLRGDDSLGAAAGTFLMSALTLGSGVARELVSPAATVEPILDSRFLTDSFLGLPGFSRDMAAAVAAAARSGLGFSGEETGGA